MLASCVQSSQPHPLVRQPLSWVRFSMDANISRMHTFQGPHQTNLISSSDKANETAVGDSAPASTCPQPPELGGPEHRPLNTCSMGRIAVPCVWWSWDQLICHRSSPSLPKIWFERKKRQIYAHILTMAMIVFNFTLEMLSSSSSRPGMNPIMPL